MAGGDSLTSIDDARTALEVLKDYCENQSSCTVCKLKYATSGNAYYCGVTRNTKFSPRKFEIEYPKSKKPVDLSLWDEWYINITHRKGI